MKAGFELSHRQDRDARRWYLCFPVAIWRRRRCYLIKHDIMLHDVWCYLAIRLSFDLFNGGYGCGVRLLWSWLPCSPHEPVYPMAGVTIVKPARFKRDA